MGHPFVPPIVRLSHAVAPPSDRAVQKQNWYHRGCRADSVGRQRSTEGSPMSTTETTDTAAQQDRELKARHRRMWALGDYDRVCREIVSPLGGVLVDALDVQSGERVLDVAAGTGSAAVRAARRGADAVASDLTPELLDVGRESHPEDTL